MKASLKVLSVSFLMVPFVSFADQQAPAATVAAATAPAAVPQGAVAEANKDITVEVPAKDRLEDAFAAYAEKRGFSYGDKTAKGSIYYKGKAAVDQNVVSENFIKSRAFAYERAYLDAVSAYVMDFFGHEIATTAQDYFGNNSSNAEEPPKLSTADMKKKIELLADAKLDAALEQAGVDPAKYKGSPVIEKRTLLSDSIVKTTLNKALHGSSGCLPVKTFESRGTDGRYYIGVVVRVGADCTALAQSFKSQRRPALSREGGLTVKEALPKTTDDIVQTFGVRLYFDETGTPSLLSFGQFGSSYKGKSARMADRAELQAQKQAKALADSALTMFINSFTSTSDETTLSEANEVNRIFRADGSVEPEELANIIDIYRKNVKQTGSDTLKGRTTVYERFVKHPHSGERVAVCVRRWSFGQVDAVNEVNNGCPAAVNPGEKPPVTHDHGISESPTYDF